MIKLLLLNIVYSELRRKLLICTCTLFFITLNSFAQIDFPAQSSYKYLKGNAANNLPNTWKNSNFDDSNWSTSQAPFRYGDGNGGTVLSDMRGNYSTVFLRTTFNVSNPSQLKSVIIRVNWDDGFVLWINGQEVLASQAPANRTYNAIASGQHESGSFSQFAFTPLELNLHEGENQIAALGCNISLGGSSDFYFDMSIEGEADLPELIDPKGLTFSHESGFYESPFQLNISTPETNGRIVYTLDGSNPQTSRTAKTAGLTARININPDSETSRSKTPAVIVRASLQKTGFKPSKPKAKTYIYLQNVKTQIHPGGDWPERFSLYQDVDLEMDSSVVNNEPIDDALLSLPSISIITDNANLFNPIYGIYTNSNFDTNSQRECSFELIFPDKKPGIGINAGLSILSSSPNLEYFPKHSLRLSFSADFGDTELNFPLFGNNGSSTYKNIDLRCAQDYSWAQTQGEHFTFLRELFSRDSQRDAGMPYTRSKFYHLYLNGLYWGLYQSQEYPEATYAASYMGNSPNDYDVISTEKTESQTQIVALSGSDAKWKELYNLAQQGFENNTNYYKLEAKNENGKAKKKSEVLLDIDKLIDYMLTIFYTGDLSGPCSVFSNNKMPDNFFAINNRTDKSKGFVFLVHNAEHTLMSEPTTKAGVGLYENRVNIGALLGDDRMDVTAFNAFHPQWLHFKLSQNMEYRIRFADRASKLLTGTGIFTPNRCLERFNLRKEEINLAIIAESARWGDATRNTPFTKANAWLPEIKSVQEDYFPYRTEIVIEQLKSSQLFSKIDAPVFSSEGAILDSSHIYIENTFSLSIEGSNGLVYYTIDGSDPRTIGGEPSLNAIALPSDSILNLTSSALIKSRVYENGEWSALKERVIIAKQSDFSRLKITEIHFNPLDSTIGIETIGSNDFEFIEIKNTSSTDAINLSGVTIESNIEYTFPADFILPPQQFAVLASNTNAFFSRYGLFPTDEYNNNLPNTSGSLRIKSADDSILIAFIYNENNPWEEIPGGSGKSLSAVKANPTDDPSSKDYWMPSSAIHGSPFNNDESSILSKTEIVKPNNRCLVYPNPTTDQLNVSLASKGSFTLRIFNLNGLIVFTKNYTDEAQVNLKHLNLASGIYLLKVETKDSSSTYKIILRD